MMNIREELVSHFTAGERVLVAMSGGVDSSVSAWAAKEAGCEVIGVTLQLFDTENEFWKDAEKVANYLGIEWQLADFRDYFKEDVISPYIATYKRGETPNPCCLCNRVGKTKYLFDVMQQVGATKIVTGHYATVEDYRGRKAIGRSNPDKDQSYYLSLIDPFHIGLMIYPLGRVEDKGVVRALAAELGLPVAEKKDSYEACFLEGGDYRDFVFAKIGEGKQGNFIFHDRTLSPHRGTFHYTIGQRRGLDISHTEPLFVKYIDTVGGDVVLSERKNLFSSGVRLRDCVFNMKDPVIFRATARLRHKMKDEKCSVEVHFDNRAVVLFDSPQFAPAPGQVTAVYIDNIVVLGGVVDEVF
ncbi:MAG: tRNA 2-thiouridine(34) synthase MnmA [Deferribacteraceae bacterium]|jgi:tRNA-specific 2-thiouridylase|nr:tRNA 2-thiouridine(34) synthase MnmA [Deferribacteraceae bacterium]